MCGYYVKDLDLYSELAQLPALRLGLGSKLNWGLEPQHRCHCVLQPLQSYDSSPAEQYWSGHLNL